MVIDKKLLTFFGAVALHGSGHIAIGYVTTIPKSILGILAPISAREKRCITRIFFIYDGYHIAHEMGVGPFAKMFGDRDEFYAGVIEPLLLSDMGVEQSRKARHVVHNHHIDGTLCGGGGRDHALKLFAVGFPARHTHVLIDFKKFNAHACSVISDRIRLASNACVMPVFLVDAHPHITISGLGQLVLGHNIFLLRNGLFSRIIVKQCRNGCTKGRLNQHCFAPQYVEGVSYVASDIPIYRAR